MFFWPKGRPGPEFRGLGPSSGSEEGRLKNCTGSQLYVGQFVGRVFWW